MAIDITGHKTRSVFDRYNITSKADLRDATAKVSREVVAIFNHTSIMVTKSEALPERVTP